MAADVQRSELEQTGFIRLRSVFTELDARRMCERVWRFLEEKYGVHRDQPVTWPSQPTGFQALTRSGVFAPIASPALLDALDRLLGEWMSPKHWGAPLVTFPGGDSTWTVPTTQWHLDFPARGRTDELAGLRVLAFVAPVAPRSGGTLVLSGSHTLVKHLVASGNAGSGRSADIRDMLGRSYDWLRGLWTGEESDDRVERFMGEGGEVDGVALRVVELTGAVGDVVLMHPWAFHAPSRNCSSAPRMLVSHSVFRGAGLRLSVSPD